jgi:hypothetical protein
VATLVVYADASDGYLYSGPGTYAAARAGTGVGADTTGTTLGAYQQYVAPDYYVYEAFLGWDTSAIGAASTVSAVVLELYLQADNSALDHTLNVRLRDWGATLEAADWIAGASLSTLTLLASRATSGIGAAGAYKTFTNVAFPANVNRTGFTRVVMASSLTEAGTAPTATLEQAEWWSANDSGTTRDPRLTITYTVPTLDLGGATSGGTATAAADLTISLPPGLFATSGGSSTAVGIVSTVKPLAGVIAGAATVTGVFTTLPFGPVNLAIEFRSRGWSGSAETFGTWHEITCQTIGASWTRGSPEHRGLLNFPENGQASLVLIDPERELDPGNSAGPWYGQIDVGSDVRLTFGGRVVFIGRITTLSHEFRHRPGEPAMAIANVQAQGFQGKLALISALSLSSDGFYADTFPDEVTYTRINRILDACAVPSADRDIQTGGELILDMDFEKAREAGSAWDVLVRTMQAEIGSIEMMTDGKIRTRNRATVWETTPAATLHLGCDTHAGAIDVFEASFETRRDTVRNEVKVTVETNDVYGPVSDATSQAKYGLRKYDSGIGETIIEFAGGPTWVAYFLARMKTPMRTWHVTLRPTTQAQVDAIELVPLYTSRVHLVIDDIGGAVIDLNLRPLGVDWSVDPAGSVVVMALGG